LLIVAEFFDAEMRTHTRDTGIAQNFAKLASLVLAQASETVFRVTYRRAQFSRLKSGVGKLLDRAGKILGDHLPHRPSLTSDWHVQRIGAQLQPARGDKAGRGGVRRRTFHKLSSRHLRHVRLLITILCKVPATVPIRFDVPAGRTSAPHPRSLSCRRDPN